MKHETRLTRFHLCLAIAAALFIGVTPSANCQTEAQIPHIKFSDVLITTAIENFARLANLNYLIDPKLFAPPGGSNLHGIPEPSLTLDWTNISANDALARILKENGLVMVQDKFTTVALITGSNHVAKVVDADLLVSTNSAGQTTGAPISRLRFVGVTLDQALKSLIEAGHFNGALDSKIATDTGTAPHKINIFSLASVSWEECR